MEGEAHMETTYGIIDRAAGVVVAADFMTVASIFVVIGCTFLPVIGILAALPVMGISLHLLKLRPEVGEAAAEESMVTVLLEYEHCCPWPPVVAHESAL
jgi:hypothetical protein